MPTTPTESPPSNREPPLAIGVFWLTIMLFIPAVDFMFSLSRNGSSTQFALAATSVTSILAAVTVGMIRYVGFRKSPSRITIMLLTTAWFAIVHGIIIFNMITQPANAANASQNAHL